MVLLYILIGIIKKHDHDDEHTHSFLEPESFLFHARKSSKRVKLVAKSFKSESDSDIESANSEDLFF